MKYYKISEKDLKCLLSRSKKLFLVTRDIRDGAEDVSEDELLRLYEPLQKEDSGMPAEMTLRDFLKTVDPSEEIIFKVLGMIPYIMELQHHQNFWKTPVLPGISASRFRV